MNSSEKQPADPEKYVRWAYGKLQAEGRVGKQEFIDQFGAGSTIDMA